MTDTCRHFHRALPQGTSTPLPRAHAGRTPIHRADPFRSAASTARSCQTSGVMKRTIAFLAALSVTANCCGQTFVSATLAHDGTELVLARADSNLTTAPKFEDQDGFSKPGVAPDGRVVGWLALYPNRGASYSQPLSLVLLDQSNRVRRLQGEFGMVYGWCFAEAGTAVALMYSFPHGVTPIGYDKRRIRDGKLLARKKLEPLAAGEDEADVLRSRTPAWAKCALSSARAQ